MLKIKITDENYLKVLKNKKGYVMAMNKKKITTPDKILGKTVELVLTKQVKPIVATINEIKLMKLNDYTVHDDKLINNSVFTKENKLCMCKFRKTYNLTSDYITIYKVLIKENHVQ